MSRRWTGEPMELWTFERAPDELTALLAGRRVYERDPPQWVLVSYEGCSVQDRKELLDALDRGGNVLVLDLPRRRAEVRFIGGGTAGDGILRTEEA